MSAMPVASPCLFLTMCFLILMVTYKAQTLDCPGDIDASTNSERDAVVQWDEPVNSTCSPQPGHRFDVGETTVSCSSEMDGSCTFRVIVRDNRDPEITCPADMRKPASSGNMYAIVTWSTPSHSDNVAVVSGPTCIPSSGTIFYVGERPTPVTCTVSDAAGNMASCTFSVTVRDDEPPYFTSCPVGPLNRLIERKDLTLPQALVQVGWEPPTAQDVSGNVVVLSSHTPNDLFPIGQTVVSYNATDTAGNTNTTGCTFTVDVRFRPPKKIFTKDASTRSSACIQLSWPQSFDDAVKEYNVSYRRVDQDAGNSLSKIVSAESTTFNTLSSICKLLPGQLYTVDVRTGLGESGEVIASTTQWIRPPEPARIDLAPGTQSPNSFAFTWPRISLKNLQQYRIRVGEHDLGYVTKTTDKMEVDGLVPNTRYEVSVGAVVGSGTKRLEHFRSEVFDTTALDQSQLLAFKYTETKIDVAWIATDSSKSASHPYMLYIRPEHGDKPYQTVFNPPAGTTRAQFTGLKPNTEYQIRLISNLGLSLSTKQKTRPGQVRNFRPTVVQLNSITVEWDAPIEGDVDSYEIYISPGASDESIPVSGTSYEFQSLVAEMEYFIKVVSIFDGMKSVPQTIMVTPGVTQPSPREPLNYLVMAVGVSLGVVGLALIIAIIVTCCKYRKISQTTTQRDTPGYTFTINPNDTATPGSSHATRNHRYVNVITDKLAKGLLRKKDNPTASSQSTPNPGGSDTEPEYTYAVPD